MKPATAYNLIFFSWPVLAAFLLLFTFISGPSTKFWLVVVETKAYGQVKIGALGICTDDICSGSGLGYDAGDKLGSIVPRFSGASVFHLITFLVILLSIGCQTYLLPKLHEIRDTLVARFLWIAPAFSALLLGICIIMDFVLVAQLKSDPIVQQPVPPTQGKPSSAIVTPGGSFYLPIPCLVLCLVWMGVGMHFLRKSYVAEETRDYMEKEKWQATMEERKRVKEENPTAGYGWFNFGKTAPAAAGQEPAQGGGWGMSAFASSIFGGGPDKDDAPAGFEDRYDRRRDSGLAVA